MIYQEETWEDYFRDCQELWHGHYDEIAGDKDKMPMHPASDTYRALEANGKLQIVTARKDGVMAGYCVCILTPHMHYSDVLCGFEDAYFLHPDYRKGGHGIRLIKESMRLLKEKGARKFFIHTKRSHDVGKLLTYLGLHHSDEIYSGWL